MTFNGAWGFFGFLFVNFRISDIFNVSEELPADVSRGNGVTLNELICATVGGGPGGGGGGSSVSTKYPASTNRGGGPGG